MLLYNKDSARPLGVSRFLNSNSQRNETTFAARMEEIF